MLLNLAQSCLKSNHPGEAVRYFQKYLREAPDVAPAQRAEAERGVVEARKKDGRLDVQAAAGAEITVDDERVGSAPLAEPFDVEPGPHVVRVKGEADQNVTVAAGQMLTLKFGAAATAGTTTASTTTGATGEPTTSGTPLVLGGHGESCRARADCKSGLKCVKNTCVNENDDASSARDSDTSSSDTASHEWLDFKPEGFHPFAGLQVLGGPAWLLASTGRGWSNDRNLQGSFLFGLRAGLLFDRHELAVELSPFTYLPYPRQVFTPLFTGTAFRVAGTYGYMIPLVERGPVSLYWPLRIGVGMVAGANNSQGLAYFEARADAVGVGLRVGHLLFDLMAPSFRYAFTHRLGTMVHLVSWHVGGNVSYVF